MAKGLDKILEKISDNPRQTLVGRYLSLIADIPDEDERAGFALDLAETIAKSKPDDALKISFMIYQAGRHRVRSLQIVIGCFEAKGRAGKVAVLKMELEKLLAEKGDSPGEPEKRPVKPGQSKPIFSENSVQEYGSAHSVVQFSINEVSKIQPFKEAFQGGPSEDTRMAELDLGDFQEDASENHTVGFLFPGNQESAVHVVQEAKAPKVPKVEPAKAEPDLQIAEGFFAGFTGRPGDTVLPVMPSRMQDDFEGDSGTVVSLIEFPDNIHKNLPGKTVNLNDLPRVTLDKPSKREVPGLRASQPSPEVEPSLARKSPERQDRHAVVVKSKPRTAAPSEVFDRFFNSKRFEEAESILEHSVSDRGFDWWRSRYERLQSLNAAGYKFGLGHIVLPPLAPAQGSEVFVSMKLGDSLIAHPDVVARPNSGIPKPAADKESANLQPFSGDFRKGVMTEILQISDNIPNLAADATPGESKGELPAGLLKRLIAMPVDTAEHSRVFFELMQGLFAAAPDATLLRLIERKSLQYRDTFWFGLYLDALLRCGYGRKIIAESVIVSEKHPTLSWLRVIWRRLPLAWDLMGVEGFMWSEDDGVRDFLEKISRRGRQRLKSYPLTVHPD